MVQENKVGGYVGSVSKRKRIGRPKVDRRIWCADGGGGADKV